MNTSELHSVSLAIAAVYFIGLFSSMSCTCNLRAEEFFSINILIMIYLHVLLLYRTLFTANETFVFCRRIDGNLHKQHKLYYSLLISKACIFTILQFDIREQYTMFVQ